MQDSPEYRFILVLEVEIWELLIILLLFLIISLPDLK